MVTELVEEYGQDPGKVICLDIPDIYLRNEPELVGTLEQRLYDYLVHEGLI